MGNENIEEYNKWKKILKTVGSEIFPIDFKRYITHIDKFATTFTQKIKNDLKESIKTELNSIKEKITSLDGFKRSLEFHTAEQDRLKAIIADSNKTIDSLKASSDLMRKEFDLLKSKVEEIEQTARQGNIEIQNVPENKSENIENIVANLAVALNVPIPLELVRSAHRVATGSLDRPRNIVIQLATRRLRDDILVAARMRRSLTTRSVQLSVSEQKIYINEHLTLHKKIFHAKVRAAKKQKGYEYVWVRNGKIYVRKSAGDKSSVIKCENDMQKM